MRQYHCQYLGRIDTEHRTSIGGQRELFLVLFWCCNIKKTCIRLNQLLLRAQDFLSAQSSTKTSKHDFGALLIHFCVDVVKSLGMWIILEFCLKVLTQVLKLLLIQIYEAW